MKKATRKILSLALVVMMLLGTFAMMFAYAEAAEAPVTTPKDYATAEDGEKLLDVNFNEHWTLIDDTNLAYDNNGVTYTEKGLPCPVDPAENVDGNGDGDTADLYNIDQAAFLKGWLKSVNEGATVIEEDGKALKLDGKVPAVGTEGEDGYVPEIPAEAGSDSRYIGMINAYDLANKTYTYEFEYFRKGIARSKFYFGNGMFINFGGSDQHMPCLGIELNASGYRLMRQSSAITTGVVGKPTYAVDEAKHTTTTMKVVLEGGEPVATKLYTGSWLRPVEGKAYWEGTAIPVEFTIYNSLTKDDGTVQDIRVCTGTFYQPADIKLVFGIGEYNTPGNNQYFGAKNLAVYKGDTSVPFNFGFTKVYAEAGWGSELTIFDAKGITNPANNFANGYEWMNTVYTYYDADKTAHTGTSGIVVDAEGVVTINVPEGLYSKNDGTTKLTGIAHGAYTNHPFGDEWNQGYYEMEMTINNASRLKLDLISIGDDDRIGFCVLPNGTPTSLKAGTGDPNGYLDAYASNAATRYVTSNNSFSDVLNKDYVKTIVYDTYKADGVEVPNPAFDATKPEGTDNPKTIIEKDGVPEDPRNVRDYGGNRANIKIVYNCVDYVITLFEKCGGEWLPTAAIDYSDAIELGYDVGAKLGFYAYNVETNATIKNIRTLKGSSVIHQTLWQIGDYTTDMYFGYDADFQAEITEAFVNNYGLDAETFGWTNDGKTIVEDFETLYNELDETNYGEQTIKLAPIVKYAEKATEATLRGVWVDADAEKGTYDVRFVTALGAIDNIAAVGYDIVKTVSYGSYAKTTTANVETTEVLASINANGLRLDAVEALGGDYVASFGLKDEAAIENAYVTYEVTVYTIALDGTKTVSDATSTYLFYNGQY